MISRGKGKIIVSYHGWVEKEYKKRLMVCLIIHFHIAIIKKT